MIEKPNYCQQSQEMHRRSASGLGKMLKELQKNVNLGPRPQTGANFARGQIASLDINKSC